MEDFYALRFRALWKGFLSEGLAFWMICGYLFFEYVRPQSLYPAIDFLPWSQLFVIGALVGWFFDQKARWVSVPPTKWLLLYLALIITSVLIAQYPEVSRSHFSDFYPWILIYFAIILNVTNRKRFYIFLLIYLFASFKMSFSLARIWAMRGFAFTDWGLQGPPGFFTNSGELAVQMLCYGPVAMCVYLAIKPYLSQWKRWMMILMPVTAAMTVLGASSRGGQVGLVYQIYALFLKGRISLKSIVATAIVAVAAFYALPDAQKARFLNAGEDQTSQQRLLYWKRGKQMMDEYPLLGVGLYNFAPYFQRHYPQDILFGEAQLPHNIFIQVGTDAGYTGLAVYTILLLQVLGSCRTARIKAAQLPQKEGDFIAAVAKGIAVGHIGFVIAGQFVTVGYYPFLWINLALSAALLNVVRSEVGATEQSAASIAVRQINSARQRIHP
ncbi:MAG: O-antigen ligase family protein [Burkholderiaceae bacterium]|jgi:O-antigen ligase|nr:O-antigen ligase family protein [Burkholderiaceae bacterium]